jgi:hypothetical protein
MPGRGGMPPHSHAGTRLSTDRGHAQMEEELRAAVRGFVTSVNSNGVHAVDISVLVQATATLPLSKMANWERLVRGEASLAHRARAESSERGWRALLPFTEPRKMAEAGRFLTWIDLVSFDGHVRERTLRTLAGPAPNSFFFALAARRLNDWVPEVRAAARAVIPLLARASEPAHVVDALCAMLPTWTSWGRVQGQDKQVVSELICTERVAQALKCRVISSSAGPMAAVLSQSLRTAILDEHLSEIATKAIQPAVRAKAHGALLAGKAVWVQGRHWKWTDVRYCQGRLQNVLGERPLNARPALLDSLHSVAADPSSIVRRMAAKVLVEEMSHLGNAALPLARQFAGDRSRTIAERGVFALQRLEASGKLAR